MTNIFILNFDYFSVKVRENSEIRFADHNIIFYFIIEKMKIYELNSVRL